MQQLYYTKIGDTVHACTHWQLCMEGRGGGGGGGGGKWTMTMAYVA